MHMLESRLDEGLYLLDEPESALSPQRQLVLLARTASSSIRRPRWTRDFDYVEAVRRLVERAATAR